MAPVKLAKENLPKFGYKCDFCGKHESEVGDLICGRNQTGRDFQFCEGCKEEKNIKKVSDIEQHYNKDA